MISIMWANHKQSEIQMVKKIAQEHVPATAFIDGKRNFLPEKKNYYKILPDCNPNDQENSHKLKIATASSKNRKMNLHLKMKLTANASWFRLCEPNITNLKSKWPRKKAQAQVLTTDFIEGERTLLPEMNIYYKILPLDHNCNSNDQEHTHKL